MVNKRLINTGVEAAAAFDPIQNFETVAYTGNGGTQKITGYIRKGGAFNGSSSKITNTGFNITGNRSVSFWVRMNSSSSQNTGILSTWNNGSDYLEGFVVRGGAANTNFVLSVGTNNHTIAALNTDWNHIALIYDGTYYQVYFNGTQVLTDIAVQSGIEQLTNLQLGARHTPTDTQYFNGKIDQVRIFDKALSSSEVTTLYGETYASSTKSTTDIFGDGSGVALYELDEDANDTGGTYNGTPTNVNFLGMAFQPDLVWIKSRSFAKDHAVFDSVRGEDIILKTNKTDTEFDGTGTSYLSSFDSNGFTVLNGATNNRTNANNETYVAWCWKAGGAAVSNTDGSITSTVSANQDAGFSIVKYTAGGTATVGHGLSQAPELIITKNLDISEQWFVYAEPVGTQKFLGLNTTSAATSNSGVYTNIGATTFTNNISSTSRTYVNYCFHSVDGYQKVGSYSGLGTSAVSITTGFQPRFIIVRYTGTGGRWIMVDNVRGDGGFNVMKRLDAQDSAAESTNAVYGLTFTSDGFEIPSGATGNLNASGNTYIYLAIA